MFTTRKKIKDMIFGESTNLNKKRQVEKTPRISVSKIVEFSKVPAVLGSHEVDVSIASLGKCKLGLSNFYLSENNLVWYCICPKCSRHFKHLYVIDGELACRICFDLTYRATQEHGTWKEFWRHMMEGYTDPFTRRIMTFEGEKSKANKEMVLKFFSIKFR
jgi:hypothetical protein